MKKPRAAQPRVPAAFDTTAIKVERSAVAVVMSWMRDIIKEKNVDLGLPDVDTSGADRKSPDIVIYESPRSKNVLCVIEAKPPYYDVFNERDLKKPAWEKANTRKARYFAVTNFKELLWFNTEKVNALKPLEEQVVDKYRLSEIENLNSIEDTRHKASIIKELDKFLTKLSAVSTGKEPEPKQAIDEFLIYRLHDKINRLAWLYAPLIDDRCHKDGIFRSQLIKWFADQGWSFGDSQDFDKAARQTAYLLVNKVLFYNVLQARRPGDLPPLNMPEGLLKGSHLQKMLQSYFDEVLKIDYDTIYTTDFIDTLAFPDQTEVVEEVKELVSILRRYDFSKLGYEIVGGIFQKLIPPEERHNLGQYFTSPDVVDLILCFCLKTEADKVFDPSCGAGTFLVRAYQHKKLMNQYLKHEDILATLWGTDIARFPAHLATINLAINDLSVDKNYPNIMQEDFFTLLLTDKGFEPPKGYRKARARALQAAEREVEYPRWFDCVVGNPPYTRQEEMAEMAPEDREYKEKTIESALQGANGRKIADISRRAGIYAYFFVHGAKFLQNGGRFGFIVSDSWLDADFGKGLQDFFLGNYKITAIIGSKVERSFEDADINTCIVILEKCSGDDRQKERDDNLVRFVYLKKFLRYFIPPAQDIWEQQVERINAIKDKFVRTVLAHNQPYEGDDFRIVPKKQSELWEEGFDVEQQKYTGSKWGKYLRAPDIFFKILEKGKGKLVPLKQVAEVRRGFTTGADPWFYVKDITSTKSASEIGSMAKADNYKGRISELRLVESGDGSNWLIEQSFLRRVARNPDSFRSISIESSKIDDFVIIASKPKQAIKGKLFEKYLSYGENTIYEMGKDMKEIPSKTKTCSARKYWYYLPEIKPSRLLWEKAFDRYHRHFLVDEPILANQRFYPIFPVESRDTEMIAAFLNSPIVSIHLEYQRAVMGQGAIEATVDEAKEVFIVNPRVVDSVTKKHIISSLRKMAARPVLSIFDELGASCPEEVSLDKVKPDRRELDKIVMGDILGLTDAEQLDVYRAVVDLVKSRLEKARSLDDNNKTIEGFDFGSMGRVLMERIKKETYGEDSR